MKIHDVIRTRRQALGLTQEGLAAQLGVSAPAVNKWERALNYPDITLLPTLARTLGVDLNTLLSFQEDMSREEIGLFLNQLSQTAHSGGCAAAFELAHSKLREFPNNDLLICNVAGLLGGILALYSVDSDSIASNTVNSDCNVQDCSISDDERQKWQQEVTALYERATRSVDPSIREYATYILASQCIQRGERERAESLLEQLPDTHLNKPMLVASLREKQGRREEAWVLLETELFHGFCSLQTTLLRMTDLAFAENDNEQAHTFIDLIVTAGKAFDFADYTVLSAPLNLALMEKDSSRALELLEKILNSLTTPWVLNRSPLYRHLPTKKGTEKTRELFIQLLLKQIETNPAYQYLTNMPRYQKLVEPYHLT